MVSSKQFVSIIVLSQSFFHGFTLNNCNRCMCRRRCMCASLLMSKSTWVHALRVLATYGRISVVRIHFSRFQQFKCMYAGGLTSHLIQFAHLQPQSFFEVIWGFLGKNTWHFHIAYCSGHQWVVDFSSCFWRTSWRLLLFNWESRHWFYVENCGQGHFVGNSILLRLPLFVHNSRLNSWNR